MAYTWGGVSDEGREEGLTTGIFEAGRVDRIGGCPGIVHARKTRTVHAQLDTHCKADAYPFQDDRTYSNVDAQRHARGGYHAGDGAGGGG